MTICFFRGLEHKRLTRVWFSNHRDSIFFLWAPWGGRGWRVSHSSFTSPDSFTIRDSWATGRYSRVETSPAVSLWSPSPAHQFLGAFVHGGLQFSQAQLPQVPLNPQLASSHQFPTSIPCLHPRERKCRSGEAIGV